MPLTMSLLRALLANGNAPLTPAEMQRRVRKSDARTILRILSSSTIHYGIVPLV